LVAHLGSATSMMQWSWSSVEEEVVPTAVAWALKARRKAHWRRSSMAQAQQSRWGWGWRGYFLVKLAGEEMVCTALITFKMEGIGMVGRHASG
jgi:hypothetical protein